MKQSLLTILFIIVLNTLQSQSELQIEFTAVNRVSGENIALDSVHLTNLTLAIDTVLYDDFSLILSDANFGAVFENSDIVDELSVYPNPFGHDSQIEITLNKNQKVNLNVFTLDGKPVCDWNANLLQGTHRFNFVAGSAGVYFITINGITKKVISLNGINSNFSSISYAGIGDPLLKNTLTSSSVGFPFVIGDALEIVGYVEGFPPDTIYDNPVADTTYIFEMGQPFYRLSKHVISTEIPSFVNVMFSVTDTNHRGVDYLTNDNFIVEEDNNPISPSETFRYVRKLDMFDYTLKTALILDNSASVANDLDDIKAAAISFVLQKVEHQEFAIFVFSSNTQLVQDYTEDIPTLTDAINSITSGFASTNLYGAVIDGVDSWDEVYTPEFVQKGFGIVFTDGDDTQGSHTLNDALAARGNKTLFMVGLGADVNSAALDQLSTSGQYISIDSIGELDNTLSQIQTDIVLLANSFYTLNYMSPKRTGDHDLKVMVKSNENLGFDSNVSGDFNADGFVDVFSGVYVNITADKLYGPDYILIDDTNQIDLKAVTYWAHDVPDYSWTIEDTSTVKVYVESYNAKSSMVTISKGITELVINDIPNNYSKTIPIYSDFALPIADFSADKTTTGVNGAVNFTDLSLNNPSTWHWDFGDGNTSTDKNPVHIYNSINTYSVILTVTNFDGFDTITKNNYIVVNNSPVVDFQADQTYIAVNSVVYFTDNSINTPTVWNWDFGDGNTSTLQNPDHSYAIEGNFNVSLIAGNADGTDILIKENYIEVVSTPAASFTSDKVIVGKGGLINFIDNSQNSPTSWEWDFGDGNSSTEQNPSNTYTAIGTYSLSLTASNIAGTDTHNEPNYILVNNQPVAAFNANPISTEPTSIVSFFDASLNNPTSWVWDFGDGNSSTLQNPQHSYSSVGTYTITLTSNNTDGSDYISKSNFISVSPGIEFTKSGGNSYNDGFLAIEQTSDGGYITAGFLQTVIGNNLQSEFMIYKLNPDGSFGGYSVIGGTEDEFAYSVQQTTDGGYIAAGRTHSDDGDVSGNNGYEDYWVVKVDALLNNIVWQKCLGGSSQDWANSIHQTSDGGYFVAGTTSSTNGDVTENHGLTDYWVVKIDDTGNIDWQRSLGGSNGEYCESSDLTSDGGYIVAGSSPSHDGDVTGNHGNNDCWIVKLDSLGFPVWQKSIGGSESDQARSIIQTSEGGYIFVGSTQSSDGDVTGKASNSWVVKLDSFGNVLWDKSYDGNANSVRQTTDGGYVVAGNYSDLGDVDSWILRLDENGEMLWQKIVEGNQNESTVSVVQSSIDGGFVFTGSRAPLNYYSEWIIVKLIGE